MKDKKEVKQQKVISYWRSDIKLGKIAFSLSVMAPLLGITRATLRKRLEEGNGVWISPPYILFWIEKKDILRSGLRNPVPPKNTHITTKNDKVPPQEIKAPSEIEPKVDGGVKKKPMKKKLGEEKGNDGGVQSSTHEKVPESPSSPVEEPVVSDNKWDKAVQEQKDKEKLSKKEVVIPPIDPGVESLAQAAVRKQKEDEMAKQKAKEDAERIAKEKRESLLI